MKLEEEVLAKFRSLRKAVADEILSMTDEEILNDAKDQCLDPDEVALTMKSKAMDMIANIRKQKLVKPITTLKLEEYQTRCLGFDCTETGTCLRYLQLWRDPVGEEFPRIETGQHKDDGCIFKIEVKNELATK